MAGEPAWYTVEASGEAAAELTGRNATRPCDQYRIQGDQFSVALRAGHAQPYALEESVGNMRVIDALFRSAAAGTWVDLGGRKA